MAIQNDNTFLSKGDLKAYHEKILPYLGGNFMISTNNSDYYSTDEKVVGVWTDGKPLYQKTVILSNQKFGNKGTTKYYNLGAISNIDKAVKLFGVIIFTYSDKINMYNLGESTYNEAVTSLTIRSNIYIANNNAFMVKVVQEITSQPATQLPLNYLIATVQYTKTTDAASSATTTPGAYDINFPNT